MRFLEVLRFEVEYRMRSMSTWIYGILLAAIPFLMMHMVDGGGGYMNAPVSVASISIAVGTAGMLITAALVGDAALRDHQWKMYPLFYTAPVSRADYLGGRLLGALAVNALLLIGIPLGLFAAAQMPYLDARMFGPFQAGAYVQSYLFFLLPNLLLAAAVLFSVAVLTRQTLPTYLAGIALFVGYLFANDVQERVRSLALVALTDPFGMAALEGFTRYWTAVELDARLVGFPMVLLWNRLLWMAVALAVLGLLHARFRFAHPGATGTRGPSVPRTGDRAVEQAAPIAVPSVARTFGVQTRIWQTIAVAQRSLSEILRNRAFLALLAGMLVFVFVVGWDVGGVVFGTSIWPVTHLIAGTVLSGTVSLVIAVLIALLAGELIWRERDLGMSGIVDTAPVPDWVSLLGRFVALVTMLVVLQAVLMAAGVVLQAMQGYHRFELDVYLRILFGLKLVDYVLLAALAIAVHVVLNQKYLAQLIVVLYYVFALLSDRFGVHHNLLVYGADPGWIYSDFNGLGPFTGPWVWFKLYWAGWALLLAALASLFWVRGTERTVRQRIALARARLTRTMIRSVAAAAALILTLGGFIFYNTNVLNDYRTPFELTDLRAEYERRYKRFEGSPQPRIAAARLNIEIYPEERAVDLGGTYRLVNRAAEPIDSIHLLIHPDVEARSLSFDRNSRLVLDDGELQYRIYSLDQALQPGEWLELTFDLSFRARGFPNSGIPTAVVRNGAYFDREWLPIVGYQPALELSGAEERRDHGLPPRAPLASARDLQARQHRFGLRDADLVEVEAVIGTSENQIAVTPGTLLREWRENGRRYLHYRTDAPLSFGAPFLSADYQVLEDQWNHVALRIFHHPTHTFNLARMVSSMKASLDYYTGRFGAYPFGQLQIVEFPRYASFATAHPHTIAYSEGSSFLTRVEEGDLDRPFFVTAHEVAHQWWGNQVRGAEVPGAALLTEMLAQYSAMMVIEKTYGHDQARRFYDYEMENYLKGRSTFSNREVPLLDVEDQAYLYYHKGAVAMYTLREHIGEARVNTALRRLLDQYGGTGPPYPTSLDLYRELRAVTPDTLHSLLQDLLAEITLWDVRTEQARVEPTAAGEFRVSLDVRASKVRADGVGNESSVPMNDLVEIGVFAPSEGGDGPGKPLYLRRHRIRDGEQTITITVPRQPARAGIDPFRKLIDRDGGNNVVDVEEVVGAGSAGGER